MLVDAEDRPSGPTTITGDGKEMGDAGRSRRTCAIGREGGCGLRGPIGRDCHSDFRMPRSFQTGNSGSWGPARHEARPSSFSLAKTGGGCRVWIAGKAEEVLRLAKSGESGVSRVGGPGRMMGCWDGAKSRWEGGFIGEDLRCVE